MPRVSLEHVVFRINEMRLIRYCPLALAMVLALARPSRLNAQPKKQTEWLINFDRAMTEARKQDRLVMAYFSGSDWDPWCQKLDEDVLETQAFRDWAAKNVVLLRVDFPREKRISSTLSLQNDQLKARFSVSKTPTFIFLDPWAEPIARCGYDELRKRKEEKPGEPKACLEYLDHIVKNRPPTVPLATEPDFNAAVSKAKSKYGILVMLITHGTTSYVTGRRDELMKDQQFVKFINANVTFASINWPEDSDTSAPAQALRSFAASQKIAPVPFQIIVYDAPYNLIKTRLFAYDPNHVETLISRIQAQLPHIDYNGGWLTDYNVARTISAQSERCIFLAFTDMNEGDWSRRMDEEIFQTSQFRQYARKNLVLVRLDFSPSTTRPDVQSAQNKTLADLFNIRGFPTIVVVNPLGQKLLDSKYMKGGPMTFLSELDPILQNDAQRRAALKD
jgi:thioredoxin-related protein